MTLRSRETLSVKALRDIPQNQQITTSKGGFFNRSTLYHYDEADISVSHRREGANIFYSTQKERLESLIGKIARFFHPKSTLYRESFYFRNNEKDIIAKDDVLDEKKATSYFVGHSTSFLSIPLKGGTRVNLMTDPIEKSINRFLVPRMAPPARGVESFPIIDVLLLSHNHLDHFQKSSLKKIVAQQPYVLSPLGDKKRLQKLGFEHVYELNWWETVSIPVSNADGNETFKITTVPANHWSGQHPLNFYHSAFLGYILHLETHDLYFAGDTARLSDDHIHTLKHRFNIKTMFQPGGPDEMRKDMKSAHQSSVDALWMHFKLPLRGLYEKGNFHLRSKDEFKSAAKDCRTIFNHIKAYKLGNVHFDDSERGVEHVRSLLLNQCDATTCQDYECAVAQELLALGQTFVFQEGSFLTSDDIVELIDASVIVPQLGSLHPI